MLERLLSLQEYGRPLINNGRATSSRVMPDEAVKKEIRELYQYYKGRAVAGCANCYMDALVELCLINEKTAMEKTSEFIVRRGKIIRDINHNPGLTLVRGNETNEKALYHIYTNPESLNAFEQVPENLKQLLAEFGERYEAERLARHNEDSEGLVADKVLNDARDAAANIEAEAGEKAAAIIAKADEEAASIIEKANAEVAEIISKANAEAGDTSSKADEEAAAIIKAAKAEAKAIKAKAKEAATVSE